jgi:hypothetical protein
MQWDVRSVDGLDRFLGTTDNGSESKVKGSLSGVERPGRLLCVLVPRDLNRFTNRGLVSGKLNFIYLYIYIYINIERERERETASVV